MLPEHVDSILFDFDYTLVDSSPVIIECISYALGEMGLSVPARELVRATTGMSSHDALKALLPDNNPATVKKFRQLFTGREEEVMLEKTILLRGVKEMLVELDLRGFRLGIVSNQPRRWIEAVLRREKLAERIDVIVGFEDAPKAKPNPAGLLLAVSRLGSSKMQTVYIGDSTVDAAAARRIKMPFIAVLTGVTSRQGFKRYSPCQIIDDLQELPRLLW